MAPGTKYVAVAIGPYSDGDASHVPTTRGLTQDVHAIMYREKLGRAWVEQSGEYMPGFNYTLDRLPAGYTVWGRPRLNDPKHVDWWLYGHPSGRTFDSPNRFKPHFLSLMEYGNTDNCVCVNCTKPAAAPRQNAIRRPRGRPSKKLGVAGSMPMPMPKASNVDDEGNPDVFRNLIDKLKQYGTVDEEIRETMSMDWRSERKMLDHRLKHITEQKSWVPRAGELVLFVRELRDDEEIVFHAASQRYRVISHTKTNWRPANWEAGVVSQIPEEAVSLKDLTRGQSKSMDLNYSGFRVEPMADPNSDDKSVCKRHKYVSMAQIRPFALFGEFVNVDDLADWDPTIENAMLVASTVSVTAKYRFQGTWPKASIYCRGLFIGADLVTVGDCVRISASADNPSEIDFFHITAIKLEMWNLDNATDDDNDEGHPYNSAFRIEGIGYTSDITRASVRPSQLQHELPAPLRGYHPLYLRQKRGSLLVIPFARVLGRIYEVEAMRLWFPSIAIPSESYTLGLVTRGVDGTLESRIYSSQVLRRIKEDPDGKKWFWGDSRAETLDLHTFNGQELALYDGERDGRKERKEIRILDGTNGRGPVPRLPLPAVQAEKTALEEVAARRGSGVGPRGMIAAIEVDSDEDDSDESMLDPIEVGTEAVASGLTARSTTMIIEDDDIDDNEDSNDDIEMLDNRASTAGYDSQALRKAAPGNVPSSATGRPMVLISNMSTVGIKRGPSEAIGGRSGVRPRFGRDLSISD